MSFYHNSCVFFTTIGQMDTQSIPLLELVSTLFREDPSFKPFAEFLRKLQDFVPFDAATILLREESKLRVIASIGLSSEGRNKTYRLQTHPRLKIIVEAAMPVVFPPESTLPDPFDGLLAGDEPALQKMHSCLGCPLTVQGSVVGCLTLDALKPGLFDDLPPALLSTLGALVGAALRNAILMETLAKESNRNLQWARELQRMQRVHDLTGESPAMQRLRQEIQLVAKTPFPVLILGETGTGKELVARSIHENSPRCDAPWIPVNCAALPESLAESELFGHEKGAFTGATKDRAGKFELAHMGTLFLDEVGDLPLAMQAKLLRALQEGEILRLGAEKPIQVDVRVLAATHRNLEDMVQKGLFRQDLWHRLHVFPLHIPPLRERPADIEALAYCFAAEAAAEMGLPSYTLNSAQIHQWMQDPLPGNARELKNKVRALVAGLQQQMPSTPAITPTATTQTNLKPNCDYLSFSLSLPQALEQLRIQKIKHALIQSNQNYSAAARMLGIDRANLHRLARRLGIND
jgi:anaerobic nitric oxide reductase transcription regulator